MISAIFWLIKTLLKLFFIFLILGGGFFYWVRSGPHNNVEDLKNAHAKNSNLFNFLNKNKSWAVIHSQCTSMNRSKNKYFLNVAEKQGFYIKKLAEAKNHFNLGFPRCQTLTITFRRYLYRCHVDINVDSEAKIESLSNTQCYD